MLKALKTPAFSPLFEFDCFWRHVSCLVLKIAFVGRGSYCTWALNSSTCSHDGYHSEIDLWLTFLQLTLKAMLLTQWSSSCFRFFWYLPRGGSSRVLSVLTVYRGFHLIKGFTSGFSLDLCSLWQRFEPSKFETETFGGGCPQTRLLPLRHSRERPTLQNT